MRSGRLPLVGRPSWKQLLHRRHRRPRCRALKFRPRVLLQPQLCPWRQLLLLPVPELQSLLCTPPLLQCQSRYLAQASPTGTTCTWHRMSTLAGGRRWRAVVQVRACSLSPRACAGTMSPLALLLPRPRAFSRGILPGRWVLTTTCKAQRVCKVLTRGSLMRCCWPPQRRGWLLQQRSGTPLTLWRRLLLPQRQQLLRLLPLLRR